jgi:LacI family transcriptional regulator
MPNTFDHARATIEDVANAAQVSKMTVSRVINNHPGVAKKTRRRILEAIDSLGYVANPAARALNGVSQIIGLIVPDVTSSYTGEVLKGVSRAAERLDYGLMLYAQGSLTSDHERRSTYYASLLGNGLADGVLLIVPHDYEVLVKTFQEHDLTYVLIDHHGDASNEPAVTATNRKGIIDAMRYLIALGHRRIGFITGNMRMTCARDRLQGYRDALAEFGIPYDEALVREGDFLRPSGFHQGESLLASDDRPTAIMVSNDMMAFGVMDAAKKNGLLVGTDVSIIGFDDLPMASQVYPALTTVRQPMDMMGEAAMEMLVTMLQGRKLASPRRELTTDLIIRDSTGKCPL